MLHLSKSGENFRQVINAQNVGAKFATFDGKNFEIVDYKKAHFAWNGEEKKGAKTEVKLKNDEGKTFIYETDALRVEFCPDYVKGTKEHKEKKVATFGEVFESLQELAKEATFEEIQEAFIFFQDLESTRRKEKEEAEEKEFTALEKRYKELLQKRTQKTETKKGKGKK